MVTTCTCWDYRTLPGVSAGCSRTKISKLNLNKAPLVTTNFVKARRRLPTVDFSDTRTPLSRQQMVRPDRGSKDHRSPSFRAPLASLALSVPCLRVRRGKHSIQLSEAHAERP